MRLTTEGHRREQIRNDKTTGPKLDIEAQETKAYLSTGSNKTWNHKQTKATGARGPQWKQDNENEA